ncbi:lysine transporter LysE [Streptomyces sp. NPDC094032]|uniref:lysine transporter LysE n=1 Tax=Streptomyces sp. NPDC094032 TaxID=3155308 RepID=UPI0033304DED
MKALAEFIGDAAVELIVQVLACLLLAGLVALAVWGWSMSPLLTGGAGGALVMVTGYGAWETLRGRARRRKGRLAAVAVVTFSVVAVFGFYALGCGCV